MVISELETSLHRFSKMMVDPDDHDDVELDVESSPSIRSDYDDREEDMSRDCEAK
jgi:hypothetical protein